MAILDETVDVDLLDALDVAQGRSLDQASLAEIKALHGALGEAGEEPADHDAFLDRVETEYLRFFTAKGKETGELRRLTEELPGAEERHRELKARSADMDGLVDRHARAAERLTNGRTQLASAVTEREEAEQAVQSVSGLKTELDRALERAGVAQRERQRAEEARDRRQALITEVTTAEESVKTADDALKTVTTAQQEEDSSLAEAQKASRPNRPHSSPLRMKRRPQPPISLGPAHAERSTLCGRGWPTSATRNAEQPRRKRRSGRSP
ncbi:hypothetical protein [Brevibacterium sp. JSBI002]|uniref:hypothetical protein n=1 Tax=Brevibacterium sp. JSBI002 TaxID=2886045 RepID=UPI00222E6E61|nr:hypothetical protein [Brevibacterium sp. JSBI002]UZD63302.1 hypothetical protein LJ362_05555 [Brevibacterium sp. JSBI002]